MKSPAKRHLERFFAGQQRKQNEDVHGATTAYELMLVKLHNDKQRLKAIQSTEAKIELKKQLVPEYKDWIQGVLNADTNQQDNVFMNLLVWTLDIAELEQALPMAAHAIKHGLIPSDQYKRTTATLIAEEVANKALKMLSDGQSVEPKLLLQYIELLSTQDMPDQVKAKLHKAMGIALENIDLESAVDHLKRAYQLDENSGVKKLIEQFERKLKNKT